MMIRYLFGLVLLTTPVLAQDHFPTPGGGTVPGVVLLCDNGSGLFTPCKFTPPVVPPVTPVTPTSITLKPHFVDFPTTANANSYVATITVIATGGPYAGTLSLGGADAAKFTLSNGGVYPTNVMVGSTDLPAGTYKISVTAP